MTNFPKDELRTPEFTPTPVVPAVNPPFKPVPSVPDAGDHVTKLRTKLAELKAGTDPSKQAQIDAIVAELARAGNTP